MELWILLLYWNTLKNLNEKQHFGVSIAIWCSRNSADVKKVKICHQMKLSNWNSISLLQNFAFHWVFLSKCVFQFRRSIYDSVDSVCVHYIQCYISSITIKLQWMIQNMAQDSKSNSRRHSQSAFPDTWNKCSEWCRGIQPMRFVIALRKCKKKTEKLANHTKNK